MERALIVEDLADSRDWLQGVLIEAFPSIEVRCVHSVVSARQELTGWTPELALVDLGLPDGSGIEVIGLLAQAHPGCLTVVTTIYGDDAHLFPALRAGAGGYLLKEQSRDQLVELLGRIVGGEPPLSPAIARRLLGHFALPTRDEEQPLTPREREVLALIAKGYKLVEVADCLGISRRTAESYLKTIYRKLAVNSRAEAALEAARRGLAGHPY